MPSAEFLGAIFVFLWVIAILRYWPGTSSAKFFVKRALKSCLWLPYGLCCIITFITFPTRGGPLVVFPDLVLIGILAGVITLVGHAILEIGYLRERATSADQ